MSSACRQLTPRIFAASSASRARSTAVPRVPISPCVRSRMPVRCPRCAAFSNVPPQVCSTSSRCAAMASMSRDWLLKEEDAIADILQYARQGHPREGCAQAEQVVAEYIHEHHPQLSVLKKRHRLIRVAGKSGERAAEAYDYKQSPARVDQYPLGRPDDEEAYDEAANDVDCQRAVGKAETEMFYREAAQQVAKASAEDGGNGY